MKKMAKNTFSKVLGSIGGAKPDEDKFCDTTIVFVFPKTEPNFNKYDKQLSVLIKEIFGEGKNDRRLRSFDSTSGEKYVFISLKLSDVKKRAEDDGFLTQLDPKELEKTANLKNKPIAENPDKTSVKPYDFVFTPYNDKNVIQNWLKSQDYLDQKPREHPFSACAQLKLANMFIQKKLGYDLNELIDNGKILGYFPLHDIAHKKAMQKEWSREFKFPWDLPIDVIRDYLGEKIGIYFKFLVHYTGALVPLAVVGMICQALVLTSGSLSNPATIFFATFAVLWGTMMLKIWKREESFTALKWGMANFEKTESMRPDFLKMSVKVDDWVKNGTTHEYNPSDWLKPGLRRFLSATVVTILNILVLCTTASIYLAKYELDQTALQPYTNYIASALNSLQIFVFGMVCKATFKSLNDFENHRTDTEYEDSMIMKYLCFQFVNSYSSFYYIAFIASYVTVLGGSAQCGSESCMEALGINVLIVLVTSATLGNFTETILPYIVLLYKRCTAKDEDGSGISSQSQGGCFGCCGTQIPESTPLVELTQRDYDELRQAVGEFGMEQYNYLEEGFEDYAELFIQFGYMILFLSSLPAIALMNLIVTYIEVYTDTGKMTTIFRRVMPQGAQDIGSWQAVFEFITTLAVPTNAGIIIFTMGTFSSEAFSTQVWYFIIYQWVVFGMIIMYSSTVSDEPASVFIQKERTKWILENIVKDPNLLEGAMSAGKIGMNLAKSAADNVRSSMV